MILVFDLGTTYFKFALVDRGGQLVALCRNPPTPIRGVPPGIVELDTAAFVEVLEEGVSQLAACARTAWRRCEP